MQKRLVRKLELERAISNVKPHPTPKAYLEQYTIPANLAAEILYIAAYVFDDIIGKTVVDLGCGTGRLAIGAIFLGAKEAIGVDIDKIAVSMARRNAEKMGLKDKTNWIAGDICVVVGSFDIVIQNPPFGVQKKGADRNFIIKSIELGYSIYSLHKNGGTNQRSIKRSSDHIAKFSQTNSLFIRNLVERNGGRITAIYPMQMEIPKIFEFHKKRKHKFKVDLYVIEGMVKRAQFLEKTMKSNAE